MKQTKTKTKAKKGKDRGVLTARMISEDFDPEGK